MGLPLRKQVKSKVVRDDIEVRFLRVRRGTQIVALAIHLPTGIKEYSVAHWTAAEAEKEARALLGRTLPKRLESLERGKAVESSYFSRMSDEL